MSALAAEPPRLDLAALAIATLDKPLLDAPGCLHMLDVLACRVQVEAERLSEKGEVLAPLRALRHVLADIEASAATRTTTTPRRTASWTRCWSGSWGCRLRCPSSTWR